MYVHLHCNISNNTENSEIQNTEEVKKKTTTLALPLMNLSVSYPMVANISIWYLLFRYILCLYADK